MVRPHDECIGRGHLHVVVETTDGEDGALVLLEPLGVLLVDFLQGHADKSVPGRNTEFQRQVVIFAAAQGGFAHREQLLQHDDGGDSYCKAEEPTKGGGENAQVGSGIIGIKSGDNQVRSRADEGADTAHARGVAQGNQKL